MEYHEKLKHLNYRYICGKESQVIAKNKKRKKIKEKIYQNRERKHYHTDTRGTQHTVTQNI